MVFWLAVKQKPAKRQSKGEFKRDGKELRFNFFAMLPKCYRLPLQGYWPKIKKKGEIYHGRFLTLFVGPPPPQNSSEEAAKFGFIVSNKISKKATVRNRIKRLLREAAWELLPKVKDNLALVISGKTNAVGKSLKEIKDELEKLCKTARILK